MTKTTAKVVTGEFPKEALPNHPVPQYHRVLLKPRPPREKIGNILLSDDSKEVEGVWNGVFAVVAIGPGAFRNNSLEPWLNQEPLKPGDFVLVDRRAGHNVTYDGQAYVLVNDRDILAQVADMYAVKGFYAETVSAPID